MKLNFQHNIKWLFIISLFWLLVEGVFRKWVFPSLTTELFALKYAWFVLLYLLYFTHNPYFPKIKQLFQFSILLFIVYCLFQVFNNPFHAPLLVLAFGYINYFFFVPLLLIVPYFFNNISRVEQFIKVLAIISIPIFILGIIQYFLPDDDILNTLANEEQKFSRVANYTRSISIFTFVKIYNVYLLFTISLFTAYLFYLLKKGKKIISYVALIAFGVLNMFMTGSRLPTFLLFLFISIIFSYIFLRVQQLRKSILVLMFAGFILSIALYNFSSTFQVSIDAFFQRAEFVEEIARKGGENYSAKDRTIDRITIFKFADEAGWFGLGIGTTYQGTGIFLSKYLPDIYFEEEGERVVLELGIIGGALLILVRLSILFYAFFIFNSIKDVQFALLVLPLVLYLIPPLFFLNNNTFNYFDGFSYWFAFGLVLALNKINQQQLQTRE